MSYIFSICEKQDNDTTTTCSELRIPYLKEIKMSEIPENNFQVFMITLFPVVKYQVAVVTSIHVWASYSIPLVYLSFCVC